MLQEGEALNKQTLFIQANIILNNALKIAQAADLEDETQAVESQIKVSVRGLYNTYLKVARDGILNGNIVMGEFYLKKAMIRLIDNAFKFTKEGQIEIGVRQTMDTIEFYVTDTGIGIKEKDQLIIFEPFVQGNGSFSRGFGGSGLGLTIAKGMTKALGASFSFISKENEGSTFSITFNKIVIDRT